MAYGHDPAGGEMAYQFGNLWVSLTLACARSWADSVSLFLVRACPKYTAELQSAARLTCLPYPSRTLKGSCHRRVEQARVPHKDMGRSRASQQQRCGGQQPRGLTAALQIFGS